MPHYATRKTRRKRKQQKKMTRGFTRDKRILKRWAVRGTLKDYEKFRRHADALSQETPEFVLPSVVDQLATADRARMVAAIHKEPHGGSWFMDGLNWMLQRLPGNWSWITSLAHAAAKPFQGDAVTEVDQEYAKLVDATYRANRPEYMENWKRMPQFDSEYSSTWVSADGHIVFAVRGTKLSAGRDLGQDLLIAATGSPLDVVSRDLQRVLASVPADKVVDAAAHSLGTALLTVAFDRNPDMFDRIRQSYVYNPAMSPLAVGKNVTEKFEKDARVRYFISLSDPVSVGDLGNAAPANVVFRSGNPLHPMAEHDVGSWYGGTYDDLATVQIDEQYFKSDELGPVGAQPLGQDAGGTPHDEGLLVSFGSDDFDSALQSI